MRIMGIRFATIGVLLLGALAVQVRAATITVTNTNDSGPGSLRQALANANNGDRINFAVTGTITLTSGGLGVFKNVTISGPGANQLSIDGNQGPFVVSVDTIATISGLTIRNGVDGIVNDGTLTISNCVLSGNSAAGIFNDGILTVSNCVVSGNSNGGIANHALFSTASLTVINSNVSDNDGTGIFNDAADFVHVTATIRSTTVSGNLGGGIVVNGGGFVSSAQATITDCTISGNSSLGGINAVGANLTVTNSTISGNSANAGFPAGDRGGGISGTGISVENSTISGNSAATIGGGIYGSGGEIVNSTISGNSAGTSGGGIYQLGRSLHVANSTITGNSAPAGGGIYNKRDIFGDSVVEMSNTILNAGALGENIFNEDGTVTSLGYNLSSDDGGGYLNGPGDQINTDPLLGPLQDNGGPTLTHAPLPSSPAINAGDPSFTFPPYYDQRGPLFRRVFHRRIDVGSLEVQPTPPPFPRPRPTPP